MISKKEGAKILYFMQKYLKYNPRVVFKDFSGGEKKRRKILSSSKNTLNATLGLYLRMFRGKKYPAKIPYFMQKYLKFNPRVVKIFAEKKQREFLISGKNTLKNIYFRTEKKRSIFIYIYSRFFS